MPNIDKKSRFIGCLVGLAVGDALGAPVEFQARGTFRKITGMRSGGPFNLRAGQWTDDTSMALCLADSLIEQGFDPADQMQRYWRWFTEGYNSVNGTCFDIGIGTREALLRWNKTGEPFSGSTNSRSAGNGALMRLAPVAMYYAGDPHVAMQQAAVMTRTTHGADETIDCAQIMTAHLCAAFNASDDEEDQAPLGPAGYSSQKTMDIVFGTYLDKTEAEIRGSGYCVESLEAALWCLETTGSFKEAVLKAVNLGDDADTTGAICGQLAGARYGVDGIPAKWVEQLAMSEAIVERAVKLFDLGGRDQPV